MSCGRKVQIAPQCHWPEAVGIGRRKRSFKKVEEASVLIDPVIKPEPGEPAIVQAPTYTVEICGPEQRDLAPEERSWSGGASKRGETVRPTILGPEYLITEFGTTRDKAPGKFEKEGGIDVAEFPEAQTSSILGLADSAEFLGHRCRAPQEGVADLVNIVEDAFGQDSALHKIAEDGLEERLTQDEMASKRDRVRSLAGHSSPNFGGEFLVSGLGNPTMNEGGAEVFAEVAHKANAHEGTEGKGALHVNVWGTIHERLIFANRLTQGLAEVV
ncbi:hypothetical protein K2173_025675 [Erythroxylum novogranatense]|uniref:Uncharacterized protein n=1 Tax=Erythroxylum novogranatense TaxID=1862640 RepID=A0AAV8SBQ8_9ROSI|nr:hypothetical protein K2173_025675 [Erythroxylum novogranatense]